LRRRQSRHSGKFNITAIQLARFLESVEAEEILLRQRMADRATRNIFALVDGKQQLDVAAETTSKHEAVMSNDANLSYTVPTDQARKPIEPELYGEF
jgi:hypothetical protein